MGIFDFLKSKKTKTETKNENDMKTTKRTTKKVAKKAVKKAVKKTTSKVKRTKSAGKTRTKEGGKVVKEGKLIIVPQTKLGLKRDDKKKALKAGKRISKTGQEYYEYRSNHAD